MPPLRQSLLGLGLGLFLLASGPALQAQARYSVADGEKPVALLHTHKETYLVTQQSVFHLEHKHFVRRYQSAAPIRCVVQADTVLWLGTQYGAICLNTNNFRARALPLPEVAAAPSITTLFRDAEGTVWLGAAGEGVFRYAQGVLHKELSIAAVNTGLATADSSVWIGTDIGLNRWHRQQWTRYNEEGVANHEILDNIVEKLLLDTAGNLWVLMSAGISVFANPAQQAADTEHLPTVKFIGKPGNEVYSVAYLRELGHVFATEMGVLLLPSEPTGHFESFEPATDRIAPRQVLVPVPALASAGKPYLVQVDRRQRVWVASAGEVSVWTAKAFRQRLRQPEVAPLSAQR